MTPRLAIKVCGVRDPDQLALLAAAGPEYLGFIFAPTSPRCCRATIAANHLAALPDHVCPVGVFRDQPLEHVVEIVRHFKISVAQLHGSEEPSYLEALKVSAPTLEIWKGISVQAPSDLAQINDTLDSAVVARIVFDHGAGGSGQRFPWHLLAHYHGDIPWILAGGVDTDALPDIQTLVHQYDLLVGVDINSRFESAPGHKDIARVQEFIEKIRGIVL